MSVWKKTMLYLGLGPEGDYDQVAGFPPPTAGGQSAGVPEYAGHGAPEVSTGVRPLGTLEAAGDPVLTPVSAAAPAMKPVGSVTPLVHGESSGGRLNTVRPIPAGSVASSRPLVISPRTFNDAQEIADRFKSGRPVVLNLQEADRDLSRRLIDFASGVCYALDGHMEKAADRVYILTPDGVEVSPEDRIDLRDQGLVDN